MKNILIVLTIVLDLSSCQEQQKIAFVDNNKVVSEFQKKKDFESKFQIKIDNFNRRADSLDKAIQIEAQMFQTKSASMSKKNADAEYQLLVQKKQMQDYQMRTQEQGLQAEGQKQIDTLVKEVKAFVKDYGKKNGYTYILGANEAGSVLYGTDENDLTQTIIDALNAETKTEN